MKKTIRLTESDLHNIIRQCVNEVMSINEYGDTAKGQYMLGRLAQRHQNNGDYDKANSTMDYASKNDGGNTILKTARRSGINRQYDYTSGDPDINKSKEQDLKKGVQRDYDYWSGR
jgi:hypothetical protein